ncbi:MAG: hypothetical protein HN457_11680 [Opitutales bacterium]|jgi:manganese-dependent ADP-ribose/CDP-alcohol diphosphatase|nr:hypothetical protein [Opitutales bacterium]MBT5814191.1 hypothetical protein [Opitutales bacterium]MBT6379681.1 hypothetical protein [Opitutales bacterium]MBT6769904.1 hypothetical protein [Opitutales bacterium]MBT7866899.1 hypothetical protein [Opitutales bacterium]
MHQGPIVVFVRGITLFIGIVASACSADSQADDVALFSFGAIADCQYCDEEGTRRQYRLSPQKLENCIEDFNSQPLAHVVHLGDFIDRDWKSFDVVLPIAEKSKAHIYHVLGNHDFAVEDRYKNQVPKRLGLKKRYYGFTVENWRFLILDTNDVSLYAYPKGSRKAKESEAIYDSLGGDLPKYNGGIGVTQMKWIEKQLILAEKRGEHVALHSHHPVYPFTNHSAWNAREIVGLLEKYSCVTAFINGHNHRGAYGLKKGIHYLTLKGMVDTEETSYATVSVFPGRIEVSGKGRQDDYYLEIRERD